MLLTKFGHSCVRISDGDKALAIDPGVFSEVETALDGVDAVLITHEHPDHIDAKRLADQAAANPALRLWAPQAVATQLAADPVLADRVSAVEAGASFGAGGFGIRTFGGQHALIHSSIPVVANVAYSIEDVVYHPGDSYTVPTVPVEVALIPLHAPWAKLAEAMDFAVALRAPRAVGIHDALLAPAGLAMYRDRIASIGAAHGSDFCALTPGESLSL
ncbi:MAG TPA: MBL fold metallo-hydrolase [Jatrophihabitans sp.]|nr:MBL fold metallo-hydrolase [Jatrophihabitans sp.]